MEEILLEEVWRQTVALFVKSVLDGKTIEEVAPLWRRITILSEILHKAKVCYN